MNDLRNFSNLLNSLTVFHNLLENPIAIKLQTLLSNIGDPATAVRSYTDFCFELFKDTDDLSEFLYRFMLEDENFYIKAAAKGENISPIIENCLGNELDILERISALRSEDVKRAIAYGGFLPDWNNQKYDFASSYRDRLQNIAKFGYGMFAKYYAFTLSGGKLTPVKNPCFQTLKQFTCYERQRNLVIQNTLALIKGRPASNVLLYGDGGTGKSSTVKAIVNEYKGEGLRLIEVKKHEIYNLPHLLEELSENPLKFIVFIDDLSFVKNDDNFSTLKAILEGGVSAKSKNVTIYATSNRRHLVKENAADRIGDDLHVNDTLQEIASLSARFGLTITFEKPGKDDYQTIVCELAKQYGIDAIDENFMSAAEAFAIRSSGRSPRAARQFVELELQRR